MSDYEEDDRQIGLLNRLRQYKSTMGESIRKVAVKVDKRSETSKANAAKARAAKLAGQRGGKAYVEQVDDESDEDDEESDESEESDEEEVVERVKKVKSKTIPIQKGKGKKPPATPAASPADHRMDRIEQALLTLANQKKVVRKKKPSAKTIIHVNSAPAAPVPVKVSDPRWDLLRT